MAKEYSTTTLSAAVTKAADKITIASASGTYCVVGNFIFVDRELMKILTISGTTITVDRCVEGLLTGHASGKTVFIGEADMFTHQDMAGYDASAPQNYIINTLTGETFFNSSGQWYGSRQAWGESSV